MRTNDWTYTQAREYLHTPSTVMRYRNLLALVASKTTVDVAPDDVKPDGWGG